MQSMSALTIKGAFRPFYFNNGQPFTAETIERLIDRKAGIMLTQLKTNHIVYPGISQFVTTIAPRYRLAVVSGALRHEIEYSLGVAGIRDLFEEITAAQDNLRHGKPDPRGYLHALYQLNRVTPLTAPECLVIEDTVQGVHAAHAAGMRCLAISNTLSPNELAQAEAVTSTLRSDDIASLERRFWN